MSLFYSEKYKGYIADVPNITFVRCDGTVFYFDEVNSAGMSRTDNNLTINGGQGSYPLAYIDTDKTLEQTFSSSQFSMEMFEMANATTMTEGDVGVMETKKYEIGEGLKITIPYECKANSVRIRGLEEGAEVSTGKFTVKITAATAETGGSTEITFNTGDVVAGDEVRVTYQRRAVDAMTLAVTTKTSAARGEVFIDYPVYSAGMDCTESAVKGIVHVHIFRARVTQAPGFDASYKSAQTNSVTFSAMDPKRADGRVFEQVYEPLDSDGNVVSKSGAEVAWF